MKAILECFQNKTIIFPRKKVYVDTSLVMVSLDWSRGCTEDWWYDVAQPFNGWVDRRIPNDYTH
jgi:hypothetical protein